MQINKLVLITIALTAVSTATADEIITEDRTYTQFTPIDFPDNTAIIVSDPINDPQLTFTDNADLDSQNALIVGNLSGESGRLRIDDGTNFQLEYDFPAVTLGPYGAHTVRVGGLYLGLNAGATGSATIVGPDRVTVRNITVGHAGDGSLHISNSGEVLSYDDVSIGALPGSTGTVTVERSNFGGYPNLEIGAQGEGELHVSDNSRVEAKDIFIGRFTDSQGSTFISGSRFETRGTLAVGQSGTGILYADNGSYVESNLAYIGQNAGSHGTATISGMDANGMPTHWETRDLIVGGDGEGTLDITDGALVTADWATLGTPDNPSSRTTVSGVHASGTPSTLQSTITIDLRGLNSELQILDGGIVRGLVDAGIATGSEAHVTISGVHVSGQRSTLDGQFLGVDAATLSINDGGLATGSGVSTIDGTISVSGIHATGIRSTIETENFAIVGSTATGSITDGGLVTTRAFDVSEAELIVSGKHHSGIRSELNVQWWGNIGWEGAPASLTALDGALIQYHSGATIADNAVVTSSGVGSEVFFNDLELEAGATLQALAGGAIHLHVDANLDGTIELQDGGTLYSTVQPGFNVRSSALITGDGGTLVGNVMSRGTIAPGNSTGMLTIDGDLHNGGTIILELAGLADFDQLLISGALTLNDGSIQIELLDGFSPHSGAEFQVMQFAELALFGETNLADVFDFSSATLAPGLSWDFSDFATTGTIRVVPEPSTLVLGTLALLGGVWLRRRSMSRS